MGYVDYEFYSAHYKSPIPEDDFTRLSFRAEKVVDDLTDNRLYDGLPSNERAAENVKMAVCEAIRFAYMFELAAERALSSASSGGSSVSGMFAGTTGVITSKSSGSESISFASPSELVGTAKEWTDVFSKAGNPSEERKTLANAARGYLSGVTDDKGVRLLYAGIG